MLGLTIGYGLLFLLGFTCFCIVIISDKEE